MFELLILTENTGLPRSITKTERRSSAAIITDKEGDKGMMGKGDDCV